MDSFPEIFELLDRELWVVTARSGERHSAMIATYVARTSLVPTLPRVSVAIAKHHFTHELIEASGAFGMHLLDEQQIDWVWRFGIPSGRDIDKLQGLAISDRTSGAPILSDALAWLDCRVETRTDTGDRTIYLAEVLDARLQRTTKPLTMQRLLQLAPPDRLQQLKQDMARDIDRDRTAILNWHNQS